MNLLKRAIVLIALVGLFVVPAAALDSGEMTELNKEVEQATMAFNKEIKGGEKILADAKGYLIFPEVTSAGIGIGGKYGQGALVIDGKIADYYSTKAASVGATIGVKEESVVITFNDEKSLKAFQEAKGWEAGVNGAITVAEMGAEGSINTQTTLNKPIVAYVYGQSGLMADASLAGSKFNKLEQEG